MRGLFVFLTAVWLAGCINSDTYESQRAIDLEFNGSPVNCVDYFAALHMCNIVNRYSDGKYNCIARASPGPVANIDQVMAGAVQFGMSHSDYVWSAVHGTGIWEDDAQPGLRALFTVHNVAATLVVRDNSEIYSISDLAGRRANLGIPDSFGQQNTVELLERSGLDMKDDIEPSGLLPKEAARALAADEIDAFFVMAASPDPAITLAGELVDIRLVPLSSPEVN